MPKSSPVDKYSDAKIYKLVAPGTLDCYIGSTCGKLDQRLWHHNHAYSHKEKQTQCSSSKLYDFCKDVSIQLVESFPCASKQELEVRERHWIENTANCINKNIPGQTWKERYEKDKDHISEVHKAWLLKNKEAIKAQRATPEYRAHQNENHKKLLEDPEYAKAHKEKRSLAKKAKVICQHCQKEMNKGSLWDHIKRLHPE